MIFRRRPCSELAVHPGRSGEVLGHTVLRQIAFEVHPRVRKISRSLALVFEGHAVAAIEHDIFRRPQSRSEGRVRTDRCANYVIAVCFANGPVTETKIVVLLARRCRHIECSVRTFAMGVDKSFACDIRDSEMREVEWISQEPERYKRELIEIGSPFEKDQLEPEFAS